AGALAARLRRAVHAGAALVGDPVAVVVEAVAAALDHLVARPVLRRAARAEAARAVAGLPRARADAHGERARRADHALVGHAVAILVDAVARLGGGHDLAGARAPRASGAGLNTGHARAHVGPAG